MFSEAKRFIAVIGGGHCSRAEADVAEKVGRELARRGAVLVCGGLGGVMEAACRGADAGGGMTIGIL
ncbi:TIGR00725 family protein, partial [Chloroflexota bacterium]